MKFVVFVLFLTGCATSNYSFDSCAIGRQVPKPKSLVISAIDILQLPNWHSHLDQFEHKHGTPIAACAVLNALNLAQEFALPPTGHPPRFVLQLMYRGQAWLYARSIKSPLLENRRCVSYGEDECLQFEMR